MTEHTPTPWRESATGEIRDALGRLVCHLTPRQPPAEQHALAVRILRAVNCHDDLVAALEGLLYEEGRSGLHARDVDRRDAAVAQAHAALARAKP